MERKVVVVPARSSIVRLGGKLVWPRENGCRHGPGDLKSMKMLESRSKVVMALEEGQTRVAVRSSWRSMNDDLHPS